MNQINDFIDVFIKYDGTQLITLFVSLVLLFVAFNLYRSHRRNQKQLQQIKAIKEDLRALASASIGVGKRIRSLEKNQKQIHARQDEVQLFEPANQSYEQAIQMAKNGNKVADIISLCGLNQTEAELVYRMHHLESA